MSREPLPTEPPLRIAVVGHTNTGKTSLLRTLARSRTFGEVSPSPATTRRIQPIDLLAEGRTAATLLDTPGLEDPIGLLERLERGRVDRHEPPIAAIERFLASPEAAAPFAQEALALQAAGTSDLLLVVIDARDRVLPRHLDELEILRRCGRPLVVLLNFTAAAEVHESQWREALARLGLHAVAAFDTVVFDAASEQRLFELIRALCPTHRVAIDALIGDRAKRGAALRSAHANRIADLLLDAATLVVEVPTAPRAAPATERGAAEASAAETLRQRLRDLEHAAHLDLLAAAGFDAGDATMVEATLRELDLGVDLFSPAALRAAGLTAAGGAAAGAATGAAIDLAVGGMSLGAAAALGAAIGGVLGATGRQARRLLLLARGGSEIVAGDPTLLLLYRRAVALAAGLEQRGHASTDPLALDAEGVAASASNRTRTAVPRDLLPPLHDARARLGRPGGSEAPSALRQRLRERIVAAIESARGGAGGG